MSDIVERLREKILALEMEVRVHQQTAHHVSAENERLRDDTQLLWDAVAEKNAEIEELRSALAQHGLKA